MTLTIDTFVAPSTPEFEDEGRQRVANFVAQFPNQWLPLSWIAEVTELSSKTVERRIRELKWVVANGRLRGWGFELRGEQVRFNKIGATDVSTTREPIDRAVELVRANRGGTLDAVVSQLVDEGYCVTAKVAANTAYAALKTVHKHIDALVRIP